MQQFKYVIVGGGLAAGYAVQEFVEEGIGSGELAILSAEDKPPYERPPLSKGFLAGEAALKDIWINKPEFYDENGIELWLETKVTNINADEYELELDDGRKVGFDKLLIATGAEVQTLDLPHEEAENIFYLRQVQDSRQIRKAAKLADKAVVLGGGFIGMESAAVLAEEWVDTTLVFPEKRVWAEFFTEPMSDFFTNYYEDRNVTILSGTSATDFTSENGRVTGVQLDNGQTLEADMVIIGVGVTPRVEVCEGTGINVDDGIVVNKFLETNMPGIYAAGDVARYQDEIYGITKRVEHWDNAFSQGQHAARNMLGQQQPFKHVPYFFSDIFDLSYEFWGYPELADEVVHRGDLSSGSFSAWWFNNGRICAAFVMDRPDEEAELAEKWIAERTAINPEILRDESQSLQLKTT